VIGKRPQTLELCGPSQSWRCVCGLPNGESDPLRPTVGMVA
jgi:hypothetical protein